MNKEKEPVEAIQEPMTMPDEVEMGAEWQQAEQLETEPAGVEERAQIAALSQGEKAPVTAEMLRQQALAAETGVLQARLMMVILAVVIIGLDQYTKFLVESNLQMFEVFAPLPGYEQYFQIMHVYNTGAAFGIFPGGGLFFGIMAVIVGLLILGYNFTVPGRQIGLRVALGLQLGGAFGNLIDRIRIGHVTDFLDFGSWPLFNVADMAIVSGAVVLGLLILRETKELREWEQAAAAQAAQNADETRLNPPNAEQLNEPSI